MKQTVQQQKRRAPTPAMQKPRKTTRLRPGIVNQSNHSRLANDKWERQADEAAASIRNYSQYLSQKIQPNHVAAGSVVIQAKLSIGRPGDRYENEADQVAEQVMRRQDPVIADPFLSPATRPSIQRLPPGFSATISTTTEGDCVQAKEVTGGSATLTTELQDEVSALRGGVGARSLPTQVRSFFEPRFGHDFSQVRIHTDDRSAKLAGNIQARAFTVGRDIAFARGQYAPHTQSGKRLLAHELTHTVQQGVSNINKAASVSVQRQPILISPAPGYRIQRQCPTGINYNLGIHPAHVPHCGGNPVTAAALPAGLANVVWSLVAGSVAVAGGTTINANGQITIDPAQTPGTITVRATVTPAGNPPCWYDMPLRIRTHPTGINNTILIGAPPNAAVNYGGVFDHVFTPNTGGVADLDNVAVGERFPAIPNPNGINHPNIPTPFGPFNLHTANLTANATNNWFLDAQGRLGGTDDQVTFGRAGVNVGMFLQSASNPNPNYILPVSFSLDQELHWYCRLQPAANRWTQFVRVSHRRGLKQSGNNVEFVTTVNNVERREPYVGHPAFFNARAIPQQIYVGQTATIRMDTLPHPIPAGHALAFAIQAPALGAAVNNATGVVTVGAQAGQITIRVRDNVPANPNFDQVNLTIRHPHIFNGRAIPRRVKVSPAAGNPNTVSVLADTNPHPLPAGHQLRFAIQGNALACNVNLNTGVLTVGQQTGNVVVRVRDSVVANPSFVDVTVTIVP